MRRAGEARLGIAHRGRRIAVDRTEIALSIDQGQAHREGLRHAHERVIDRRIAMRVIFAHHVADDAGAFHVRPVGRVVVLVHREQNAAVHGLQPVAHVGQGAADDHAHRVSEIALPHFVGDGNRSDVGSGRGRSGVVSVGQGDLFQNVTAGATLFQRALQCQFCAPEWPTKSL